MALRKMILSFAAACLVASVLAAAEEMKTIQLPQPQMEGGKPLMQALKERRSTREYSDRKLSDQVLSNLLWAANGVNRPDGKRTAPSARNWQEVDVYVATADGVFLYDAPANALKEVLTEDIRALTGRQPFVGGAPVNLIYVADLAKTGRRASDATRDTSSAVAAGCITQNVYLFCASEGLNTVVRGIVPRDELGAKMQLRPEQRILLAQTIGYPRE